MAKARDLYKKMEREMYIEIAGARASGSLYRRVHDDEVSRQLASGAVYTDPETEEWAGSPRREDSGA